MKKAFDQKKYIQEYNKEHYARVIIDIPKEMKQRWKSAAELEHKPLTAFVREAVNEKILRNEEKKDHKI